MTEKICFCGHGETKHKYLNLTIEQVIQRFVNSRHLVPKHSPDLMRPEGYFVPGENNGFYPYESIEKIIINLRENHSSCQKKVFSKNRKLFSTCECGKFVADNLKYLEVCCERKASQIVH